MKLCFKSGENLLFSFIIWIVYNEFLVYKYIYELCDYIICSLFENFNVYMIVDIYKFSYFFLKEMLEF